MVEFPEFADAIVHRAGSASGLDVAGRGAGQPDVGLLHSVFIDRRTGDFVQDHQVGGALDDAADLELAEVIFASSESGEGRSHLDLAGNIQGSSGSDTDDGLELGAELGIQSVIRIGVAEAGSLYFGI